MKSVKILLLALGTFCTLSIYAQEEFFGNNTGLSGSYSQNYNYSGIENQDEITRGGQLSLSFKNGLILAGDYITIGDQEFHGANIGYLVNNKDNNKLKCLMAFSYGELIDEYKITSINIGLMKVLLANPNFPFSLSASTSLSLYLYGNSINYLRPTATIGFSQSFFCNSQIYPVLGIGKTFLLFNNHIPNEEIIFHIGLNIKLAQSDTKK